ncbi:MAG: hypothetical protein Q8Q67_00120 [bacterium]|nr:hypothetical protein [bacterium]
MNKRFNSVINRRRLGIAVAFLCILVFSTLSAPKEAHAFTDFNQAVNNILTPIWAFVKKAYEKGGAAAFQKATRSALNKIAFDTATWIGSGNEGQKPLFVTQGWGDYLAQIGDEAAGEFIEGAVKNWANSAAETRSKEAAEESCNTAFKLCGQACVGNPDHQCNTNCFREQTSCVSNIFSDTSTTKTATKTASSNISVCQPSSLEAKLKITLGLVDYKRPQAPNCSATKLVDNWESSIRRIDFLDEFKGIFNPVSNDLGIYMSLRAGMQEKVVIDKDTSKTQLTANGGWLDVRNIAGNLKSIPGDSKLQSELAQQGYISNMATFSGDALIDAANVFLNQLALTAFKKAMSNLGKTATDNTSAGSNNRSTDPNVVYGEKSVKESLAQIIEPNFSVRADYNILSALTICRDRNNPGPTECVIDDQLMEGITEKKTVAEAIREGYLRKDWLVTSEYREGAYNLRNLQIMRKYRLISVGWEVAAASGKTATLGDLMSCFSDVDQYNEYSSTFNIQSQTWCRGLVDPNWVLKAPLNYCAKQGYSGQILDISVVPGNNFTSGVNDETVLITRAGDYCADEQTCIKEKEDGSCEAYGYCQSERQTWSFDSKSCSPINNTCTSFVNSTSGQSVSYLENTLDFAGCSADSVGCKLYSVFGTYATSTGQVSWSGIPAVTSYFNNKMSGCSPRDEGCTELLRAKPGWGANLIMGAGFVRDNIGDTMVDSLVNGYWPIWSTRNKAASIIDAQTLDTTSSGKVLLIESIGNSGNASTTIGLYSNNAVSLIPTGLNLLSGETYTFSADVYLIEGEKVHLVLGGDYLVAAETKDKGVWRHLSVTRSLKDKPLSEMTLGITNYGNTNQARFAVRNIKLEMNPWDSGFSLYGSYRAYEKLIPPYLAPVCYVSTNPTSPDYRLRADAPVACADFARLCNRDEAGCERYTQTASGFSVAAQAVSADYCDASCNGYNVYVARSSYFFSPYADKIIPANSQKCGAAAAGCTEFTNLDAAASGGETREYYTQLKQCIKPGADCADFYTWVGNDENGYQLKALVLKKDASNNPAVTVDDSASCNEAIFNLPVTDPGFNADCRQYYNKAGAISYHLSASTITCSEDCHTYRQTEKNIDTTLTQAQCTGPSRSWNAAGSVCYSCQNGGTWSTEYQSCIYSAIPNEGKKCTAAQNGCREYNGSLGNNTKLVSAFNFENGLDGWEGRCGDAALLSQSASTNNGKSLFYDRGANSGGVQHQTSCEPTGQVSFLDKILGNSANAAPASYIQKVLGSKLTQGSAYSLKFTASAATATNVSFAFLNANDEIVYFNASENNTTGAITVSGNNEWRTYEVNLAELNHAVTANESLVIVSNADFYIDNIVLTAINSRYYLIKGSSKIPDICYYDMLNNYQGEDYNLGCSQYLDRARKTHYLRQFNRLCQDSAVGCELMVDTANSDNFNAEVWKDTNENGVCDSNETECISVPKDKFIYAIFDESKRCNGADAGCSRLGESSSSGTNTVWSDVFKRNDPDTYNQILCEEGDAGCEAWRTDEGGMSYFKNPGNNACVYRASTDPSRPGKNWYKVPVMRCDINNNGSIGTALERSGSVCSSAADCAGNRPCLVDNNDYDCSVSYLETIGYGGGGQQVPVPSEAAGLCEAKSSGCTEYIDPVSTHSPNLIFNPSLTPYNGWQTNNATGKREQRFTIDPNTLHIFSLTTSETSLSTGDVRLTFDAGVALLQGNNELTTTAVNTLIIPAASPTTRLTFYSRGNNAATISRSTGSYEVVVREAITSYQLKQQVDQSSCNGIVNADNGCILFNERSVNGASGYLPLSGWWNAAASFNGQSPAACTTGNCSANKLIKVRPDRVCATWLDCQTYIVDPETNERTCFSIGECNRLGDNNECTNFVKGLNAELNQETSDVAKATGYSLLNQLDLSSMVEVGLNTDAHFNFEEGSPNLTCKTVTDGECKFDNGIVADSIVNSPNNAPTDYPAEGKAYLKVMSGQLISPHSENSPINIVRKQDYYLNFLVNTKDSGLSAFVRIVNAATKTDVISQAISAPNGWERKVVKIPKTSLTTVDSIIIYVGVNSNTLEERYVYFDDINIEPVLKVSPGSSSSASQYIAKECRLYPTQDAAFCISKNSQVIRDGLYGYCLQHDPANKNVCLMWYPIDEISAGAKSARSNLGYQGAFPLNYCVEADGNFTLVEKRAAQRVYSKDFDDNSDYFLCYYENEAKKDNYCAQNYVAFGEKHVGDYVDRLSIRRYCEPDKKNNFDYFVLFAVGWDKFDVFCIPNKVGRLIASGPVDIFASSNYGFTFDVSGYSGWYPYNGISKNKGGNLDQLKTADPAVRVYDFNNPPADESQLKLLSSSNPDEVFYPTCSKFVQVVDSMGNNKAWAARTSKNSAYPLTTPLFFRDATTYYGESCYKETIGGNCAEWCSCGNGCECDEVLGDTCYHPSCQNVGDCMKYEVTTGESICGTPGAIPATNSYSFSLFGRNRDLIPFGAATFPDNFNITASEPIKFRNQYSKKIDQTVFGGRPYGCSGVGCSNLGFCSLDPNIICVLDPTSSANKSLVSRQSCGTNGTCMPLWNASQIVNNINYDAGNILKNVFLKNYAQYSYSTSTRSYSILTANPSHYRLDYLNNITTVNTNTSCSDASHLTGNDSNYSAYWCANWPKIENIRLNGNTIPSGGQSIPNPGIYTLTFNTKIDPEQQPMKELIIDWGDGSVQSIVNQNNRPNASEPHRVYHFYKGSNQLMDIRIKASDNWGSYCCTQNSSSCGSGGNCPTGTSSSTGGSSEVK